MVSFFMLQNLIKIRNFVVILMIKIFGNSSERVFLKDLNDVVYYKQIKEYTDQEYETSKDLKRALNKHALVICDQKKALQGSADMDGSQLNNSSAPTIGLNDLKTALKEILPDIQTSQKVSEESLKGAVREIAPLIVDMVRQEMSKVSVSGTVRNTPVNTSGYMSPEYVPEVNTDGLKVSIKAKKRSSSSENVDDSLAALRLLKKNKQK